MIERESATLRCPKCRRQFRVLADEVGMHDCPNGCFTDENEEESDAE